MKLLCIQLRQLGDVLMTTPALSALKTACPGAEIHFLVQEKCAPAIRHNPAISRLWTMDGQRFLGLALSLRRECYDAVLDFQGLPKTALLSRLTGAPQRMGFIRRFRTLFYTHAFAFSNPPLYSPAQKARLLEPLKVSPHNLSLHLPVSAHDEAAAAAIERALNLESPGCLAAFSPVSRRNAKRWPLDRYAEVCSTLHARHNIRFLPLFGPGEAPVVEQVISLSQCPDAFCYPYTPPSFNALLPLLKKCAFYFGNDNGIRHVAIAAGIPTAAVFGVPDPRVWTPPDDARHVWCWGKEEMKNISVTEFSERIEKLLHENKIV